MLEIDPTPILDGIEGDIVQLMCGPIGADPIDLLVNGVSDSSLSFDDSTGFRTYSVGPLDRAMNGTTYQCTSGALSTAITTLVVYCEYCLYNVLLHVDIMP